MLIVYYFSKTKWDVKQIKGKYFTTFLYKNTNWITKEETINYITDVTKGLISVINTLPPKKDKYGVIVSA